MTTHSVLSRVRAGGGRLLTAALFLAAAAGWTAEAESQQRSTRPPAIKGEGAAPDFVRPSSGFKLFGNADLAGTGMKMTREFGWGLSNYGPCADGFILFECGDILVGGAPQFEIFEVNITAGTPPHEFRKIRTAHPEIQANVSGDGYTHLNNYLVFGGRVEVGPADGTLGVLFSGATSTSDGSCRDNTGYLNGYMSTGVSLLAGSTCPDTWANGVFDGPRPIPDSAFIRAFNADPMNYNFDYWQIPANELDQTGFLGDFSTYGRISDHYTEILASYGGVTRLGSGPAVIQGYPLGLVMDFQAFSFGLPQIANAVFWQMTVVNNSEALYGTGIDYDSLYMGLHLGWGYAQVNSVYYVPSQNAVKVSSTGTSGSGSCNNAITPAGAFPCATTGFAGGAIGVVGLKSPIGDTRNKLFTRPGPFFNPSNVHAGDTITFNHGHQCGFGSCWDHTINVRDRRGFGMISSTSENVLDGRTPGALTATQNWRTFRNQDFPVLSGKFNYYVPGDWDYNHDGNPDTLFFDTCHVNGCVATWADTMPGRQVNRYSNVGGVMTAGPFSLAAGDTTSFIWAFVGAPDSASFEALVNSVIDSYLSFYLTPKPPPVPPIVSVELEPATLANGEPFVRLSWGPDPESYVDPFLQKFANDLGASSDPSLVRLRTLNPNLQQEIMDRAEQNFSTLYIFKSCDGGTSFTNDADCVGDEARGPDGSPIRAGWQPYATFVADENGNIPNEFTDANVIGGRTYLYTIVTQSRGFSTTVLDSIDTDGDGALDAIGSRIFTVADTILSSLQRSGPTTARVYVPISLAAGATPANVTFTPVSGAADVPLTARFTQNVAGGKYRMVFANRFEITTVTDTLTNELISTTVKALDVVNAERASDPGVTLPDFPLSSVSFTTDDPVQINGSTTTIADSIANDTRVVTNVVSGLGFVLVNPASEPLFVTTSLTPTGTTPSAFQLRQDFPGFILSVDNAVGGSQTLERIIKTSGDTVVTGIMNNNALQLQEGTTVRGSQTFGLYTIDFVQDPFGPGVPFVIDFSDVADVRADIDASLTARQTAATSSTDQGVADVLGVSDLIQVSFPFTITNRSANRQTILAMRAAHKQSTILIGAGADTLRVQVPDDVWVPGDQFYVLEVVQRDSVANGNVVLDGSDQPIQVTDTLVAFGPMNLGCNSPRVSCNPLAATTRGSTGYLPYDPQWYLAIRYATPFTFRSEVELDVQGMTIASSLSDEDLKNVLVVPNPFIFQSQFDEIGNGRRGEARVLFTNVPARGTLRVFSVSGQFLQQLSWTEADLNATGDLPYNLQTREGTELASGLYIFVITAENGSGGKQYARGKFVVIR
jgi:hypothetical protein